MSDTERIPQHRHCRNCGKAFTGEGDYCSKECEDGRKSETRQVTGRLSS